MGLGLLFTAFGLGLRHGVDWDHIAAIADLNGTTDDRRRGFGLSMFYAVGHGVVVFVLGAGAIGFGMAIPESFDVWMGRVIGLTLITLGAWIILELARKGRAFRLRSRWMLVIDGTFAGLRKVRTGASTRMIEVEHVHPHEHGEFGHDQTQAHDHAHLAALVDLEVALAVEEPSVAATGWRGVRDRLQHSHSHAHRHELTLPTDAAARYGGGTATGIGMLHGIGIESPTQIAVFVAATSVAGLGFSLVLLGMWVAGLIVANAVLAFLAGAGLLHAERSFPLYATLAVIVSVMSVALGTLYLSGLDILPGILS